MVGRQVQGFTASILEDGVTPSIVSIHPLGSVDSPAVVEGVSAEPNRGIISGDILQLSIEYKIWLEETV